MFGQFSQKAQIFRIVDIVAFDKDRYEVIISEDFLELIRLDKHRISFHEIAVPGRFEIDFFRPDDGKYQNDNKACQKNKPMRQEEPGKMFKFLIHQINVDSNA